MSENSFSGDHGVYFLPIEAMESKSIYCCLLCGNETRNIHIKVCNDCVKILSQIIKEKRDENKHGNKSKFFAMINKELSHAESKHPKFCDFFYSGMTIGSKRNCIELEKKLDEFLKRSNDKLCKRNCIGAIDILDEEIQEARLAYAEGDLLHCLQELAQCGAVILRTMEFVKNKMEKK